MMIPRNTTSEYPTRYRAWDAERVLWLNTGEHRVGPETAVYADTMVNERFPNLRDGVYAEVRATWDGASRFTGWYIDVQVTRPDQSREQHRLTEEVRRPGFSQGAGLADALTVTDRLIREAYAWLRTATAPDAPACTVRVDERCPYYDPRIIRGRDEPRIECPTCYGILST